ncbi:hypothetical protein [Neobacillus niacini]|uniref:hypothetical protein n=1 Tax=Neobacillus niacini TaxID=86668 RepID=UPI0021CB5FE1|nr:hypothetical protein [Neobacillus niacini]MCM3768151.1 hypothetical protein [Neobacillus niacini]
MFEETYQFEPIYKIKLTKVEDEIGYLDSDMEETCRAVSIYFDIHRSIDGLDYLDFDAVENVDDPYPKIGSVCVDLLDDDWYNQHAKVRTYQRGNSPSFVAVNTFDPQYQGIAKRPKEEEGYLYKKNAAGETLILVDGRIADINYLWLQRPFHTKEEVHKIMDHLTSYLMRIFKVDFFMLTLPDGLSEDDREWWETLPPFNEEGEEAVIQWNLPSVNVDWFLDIGFLESANKALVGKATTVRERLSNPNTEII